MPLAPGRYFVAATPFSANEVGDYQLTATAVESGTPSPLQLMPGAVARTGTKGR